jgi:hypothetical protein
MKSDEHKDECQSGSLQWLRRFFGKLFCKKADNEQCVSDEEIRNSIHSKSATSTHQKPGADKNP